MSENKKRTVVEKMGLISRFAWNYAQSKTEASGLSSVQQKVCISIFYRPGLSQDDVAHELGMDKSSIAKLVAKLIASEHISRETNPADRREYMLYLEEKGKKATEEFVSYLKEYENKITAGLDSLPFEKVDAYLESALVKAAEEN